ncbi:MAG: DUF4352 domain-containing protein [Desulfurococcales archaeon]|nr:DUF4352 domain-containing protein [Desulfurococcales archaeon]
MRRGISPVIATVIIVAVAIAIALAVASWLFGIWAGFGEYESLKILPSSYMNSTHVILDVYNPGSKVARVTLIEVNGTRIPVNQAIQPGETTTIAKPLPFTPQHGVNYLVKLYTSEGNIYQTIIQTR